MILKTKEYFRMFLILVYENSLFSYSHIQDPNMPFGLGGFGYPYYKDNGHPNKDQPMHEVA